MAESEMVEELTNSFDQDPESSLQIYREVFDLCDRDGNGFISRQELSHICQQVSNEEVATNVLDSVMATLDGDHDGNISFEEFKEGFQAFQHRHSESNITPRSNSTPRKPLSAEEVYESEPVVDEEEVAWREVADRIDPQGTLTGVGVGAMWKAMNRQDPGLLENFESFLSEIVSELKQSDLEKSTLQNHVKRMVEQHSREVSEMDHLLQEELQLAKVSHQQNNASRSSRLSSHYSSLLAEREAVIEEMATHEMDLKRALEQKMQQESELKQEKTILLTANKVLQEKLVTAGSQSGTEDGHSRQPSEEGVASSEEGVASSEEDVASSEEGVVSSCSETDLEEHRLPVPAGEGEGPLSQAMEDQATAGLRLEVMQENSDTEHKEIKYFPPRNLQSTGSPTAAEENCTVQALTRRQLTPDDQRGAGPDSSHPRTSASPAGTFSSQETTGTSAHSRDSKHSRGVVTSTDTSLALSGVMPRRNELPSPSPSHLVNRVFKVIFLGDSGVGKSSLVGFLTDGHFSTSINSTVGLDYSIKTLRVGDERVVFQLWDTAGQERFNNALTPVYFRRADAFVIVYDVTNVASFKATKKWVSVIKAALREQPPAIMLVGNKSDKAKERCVGIEDGRRLALELQAMFSEMSALSGDNVLQSHTTLAQLLLARENADLQEMKKAPLENAEKSKCGC